MTNNFRIFIVSLLSLFTTASVAAPQLTNGFAKMKVAQEMAGCAAYMSIVARITGLTKETQDSTLQVEKFFVDESIKWFSYEATNFNVQYEVEQITYTYVQVNSLNSVIEQKQHFCLDLMDHATDRYNYWNTQVPNK